MSAPFRFGGSNLSGSTVTATGSTAGRTLAAHLADRTNILGQTGVDATGVVASDAAFAAAAALGKPVYVPAGRYKLTDMVTLGSGQMFFGDGRTKTIIVIEDDYNMSALGVLRLHTSETGSSVFDIGFEFEQPDSATRGDYNQYPPAIYAVDAPRFEIDRVRITGAWDGIDATGNTGGAWIGRLECGALNKGLQIDGALDFWHADSLHFWPFGFTSVNRLAAWEDGSTIAVEIGRCDGLAIGQLSTFEARVVVTNDILSAGRSIGVLQLDSDNARITYAGGYMQVGTCYNTKSDVPTVPSILVTGGQLIIGLWHSRGGPEASDVLVTGGTCQILGGYAQQTQQDQSAFEVQGGGLAVQNVDMLPSAGTRTVAYVRETSAGQLVLEGCKWPAIGASTGNALAISADNALHSIADNQFGGWGVSLPSGATLGDYDIDTQELWTPAPGFATPGDAVFSSLGVAGRLIRKKDTAWLECLVQFGITHTTAAGGFFIDGWPFTPPNATPLDIGRLDKVTFGAGFITAELSTDGNIYLYFNSSNASIAGLAPANFPTGTTGVIIRLSGEVRLR